MMDLIVITRPDFFEGEAKAITMLLDAGIRYVHVRKPGATRTQVANLIKAIPDFYRGRLTLHDHFDLTADLGVWGIHLNSHSLIPPTLDFIRVSRSCHTLEEVKRYKDSCTYVFLSPIFDSISKAGYCSAFSPDTLRDAAISGIIDSKVVALGGVSLDRIRTVRDLGFGGAALLGDVWSREGQAFAYHLVDLLRESFDPPVVLAVAGSDCSGGAGIQADIKAISALGGYAAAVPTAITVQNTRGVKAVYPCDGEAIVQQFKAVMKDLDVGAIKIGMIPNSDVLDAIIRGSFIHPSVPIVCDPVMLSTSRRRLMPDALMDEVSSRLFPGCALVTPNLDEAARLGHRARTPDEMDKAALDLANEYGTSILLKGGHLRGDTMVDVLCHEGELYRFHAPRICTHNLHGTGCTLSSAIATGLARGETVYDAVAHAKDYVTRSILAGRNLAFGHGNGPLWHFFR